MPTPVEAPSLPKDLFSCNASVQLWSMSRRALRGSSGTYNVRASELARQKKVKAIRCIVFFLDDSQQAFEVDKNGKGQLLLDFVFQHLELVERDYFGLQYTETANSAMRWLDPTKSLRKQLKIGPPYLLYFRVKFYISDPSKLQEEYTRYHFFLQVKRDILDGRLVVPPATAALLASYAVQSEIGDWLPEEHHHGYLSEFRLVPNQTEEMERKIAELHKLHRGQMPVDAEYNFLDHAKRLDMYGVDLHKARDSTGSDIQIGVTSAGLVVFQNSIKINTFSWAKIIKISFKRKQFFIQLRREGTESYDSLLGFNLLSYRSCKNLWKSCVEHHTFFRLNSPQPPPRRFFLFHLGSRFRYSGRTEYQTLEEGKRRALTERTFLRSPSKKYSRQTVPALEAREKKPPVTRQVGKVNGTAAHVRPYDSFNPKIQVTEPEHKPRKAWSETPSDENTAFAPSIPPKMIGFMDEEDHSPDELYDLPSYDAEPNSVGPFPVVINIEADSNGRFGFNVKGGADQGMPVLVSRVAPGTPAALCYPKLMEGDELVSINGVDVTTLTHEQVVKLIRSAGETGSRELILRIYPTTLYGERKDVFVKEPDFLYIPAFPQKLGPYCDELVASMLMLAENMDTSALELQYQKVERRMSSMNCEAAEKPENRVRNRYSDVLPYDSTRVLLSRGQNGNDYINANHIHMEIPSLAVINRYIATQGPLLRTIQDFWQMVWEQSSSLILMLTQLREGNHSKCCQYWPETSATYGRFKVTSVRQLLDQETSTFMIREFVIYNNETGESREVTHMQYMNWPDYGVPADPADFIKFVFQVRKEKAGMVEPLVVHCSAGVGRTGVFALVDTALCLIEANEPVYPHEILHTLRTWRALLVQNFQQFKFACQIILRCFNEESIVPSPEYRR